jgi:hypothetical protein
MNGNKSGTVSSPNLITNWKLEFVQCGVEVEVFWKYCISKFLRISISASKELRASCDCDSRRELNKIIIFVGRSSQYFKGK